MENELIKCACGCGEEANRGKWKYGHWNRGRIFTEEHCAKISADRKGKTYEERLGEEKGRKLRELQRQIRLGRKHSDETKKRIGISKLNWNQGKNFEEMYGEEKANRIKHNISQGNMNHKSWNKGYTKETHSSVNMISQSNKGKIAIQKGKTFEELYGEERTKEMKRRLKEVNQGKKLTQEIIDKGRETTKIRKEQGLINPGTKGYHHSEEHKEHMRKLLTGRKYSWGHKISATFRNKTPEEKIEIRKRISMARQEKSPEEWKEFTSYKPYTFDFSRKFKEMIKERDNYSCVVCNLFEDDCVILYKKKLNIHHIDYDKKNTFPQNCVSLCVKCHTPTNYNRDHWKTFFQSLLKERYGYEYTLDQKIILDFRGESNA